MSESTPVVVTSKVTPARAALAGNPSDGFGGAVVAMAVPSLCATVTCEPAAGSSGLSPSSGLSSELAVLVDAAHRVGERRFGRQLIGSWSVSSSIPREVGLSGSSAIVIGVLRCQAELAGVDVDANELAVLALKVEAQELGWNAGLQDRLVQAHGGLIAMDFAPGVAVSTPAGPAGAVERLESDIARDAVLVWRSATAESSHLSHSRVDRSAPRVVLAMERSADAARRCADALRNGDRVALGECMATTWACRLEAYDVRPEHRRLVEDYAVMPGVAVNQAGSGGAVLVIPTTVDGDAARDSILRRAQQLGDSVATI